VQFAQMSNVKQSFIYFGSGNMAHNIHTYAVTHTKYIRYTVLQNYRIIHLKKVNNRSQYTSYIKNDFERFPNFADPQNDHLVSHYVTGHLVQLSLPSLRGR